MFHFLCSVFILSWLPMVIVTWLSESVTVCLNIMTTVTEQAKRLMTATVRSILSSAKVWNQKKKPVTDNSEITSTYFSFFCHFYKDQTKWISATLGWGLTYWSGTRKWDRSILIKITKPINPSHRSALRATLKFLIKCLNIFHSVKCPSAWCANNTMHLLLSYALLQAASFVRFLNTDYWKWKERVLCHHGNPRCTKGGKEYLVAHQAALYPLHLSPPSLCLSWNSSTSQEQRAWEENKVFFQRVQPIF